MCDTDKKSGSENTYYIKSSKYADRTLDSLSKERFTKERVRSWDGLGDFLDSVNSVWIVEMCHENKYDLAGLKAQSTQGSNLPIEQKKKNSHSR